MNHSDISDMERDYAERMDRAERLGHRAQQIITSGNDLAELVTQCEPDIWDQLARVMREHTKARHGDPVAREAMHTALDLMDQELSAAAYEFARQWEE